MTVFNRKNRREVVQTPEERREDVLAVMRSERFQWLSPEDQWKSILSHFDPHEPAVADAIRYGLKSQGPISDWASGWDSVINESIYKDETELFSINYPKDRSRSTQ